MTLNQSDEMTRQQVMSLMACMLSTACVDGVTPQELTLMRGFYEQSGLDDLPPFSEVDGAYGDAVKLASECATDPEFSEKLVLMSFMAAYADGHLTEAERSHVFAIASSAGLSEARTRDLLQQVKDTLISAIAMLPDAESVARIAEGL